jgi:ABC-type uncharacterized transport system substrate-binding protein
LNQGLWTQFVPVLSVNFLDPIISSLVNQVQVITGPKDITQKELSLLIQYLTLSEKKQKAVIVFKVFRSPIL